MRNGDLLDSIECLGAGRDVVNLVKNLGAVVSHSTSIADANCNSLEYDETLFVLEGLAVDLFWTNSALAVLARLTVTTLISGLL